MMQIQKPKQGYKLVKSLFGKYEEIPDDWKIVTLPDAKIKVIDGDRGNEYPKEEDFSESGYCLFLTAKNVTKNGFLFDDCLFISSQKDQKLRKGRLSRGDIIITTRGTVGNIAYFDEFVSYDIIRINSGMAILRSDEFISQKFLYYILKSRFIDKQLSSLAFGSAQPQLTIALINSLKMIIPQSIQEQQKIASILSNVDSLIQQTQNEIEQTQRLKNGLMWRLLTKGIGTTKFTITKLGSLAKFASGEFLPENNHIYGDIPVYGGNGVMGWHNNSNVDEPTIVIGRVGAYCGSVHLSQDKSWVTDNAIFIKKLSDVIDLTFLFRYLSRLDINSFAEVAAQPKISQGILNHIKIKFPKNKQTQQKIASILSNVDFYIDKQQEYKSNLENLKKGLMQKLLTGQIRVKV